MPVYRTFAKRKDEAAKAGIPVVYRYDQLPEALRVQFVHILQRAVFPFEQHPDYLDWWRWVHDTLANEIGVLDLVEVPYYPRDRQRAEQCIQFLLESENVDQVLSLIELCFVLIDGYIREVANRGSIRLQQRIQTADEAIDELNRRFQEHAIGYQYQAGQIIEVSSQYLHTEAVEPAIALIHTAGFEGASEEFMTAHKHFREGNGKEAIAQALNAFESTMKIICEHFGWSYSQSDTASKLVTVLFDNGLVPSQMLSHFNGSQ